MVSNITTFIGGMQHCSENYNQHSLNEELSIHIIKFEYLSVYLEYI